MGLGFSFDRKNGIHNAGHRTHAVDRVVILDGHHGYSFGDIIDKPTWVLQVYHWMIQTHQIVKADVCFEETEGSSHCQGARTLVETKVRRGPSLSENTPTTDTRIQWLSL